jgi:hypothetical protein
MEDTSNRSLFKISEESLFNQHFKSDLSNKKSNQKILSKSTENNNSKSQSKSSLEQTRKRSNSSTLESHNNKPHTKFENVIQSAYVLNNNTNNNQTRFIRKNYNLGLFFKLRRAQSDFSLSSLSKLIHDKEISKESVHETQPKLVVIKKRSKSLSHCLNQTYNQLLNVEKNFKSTFECFELLQQQSSNKNLEQIKRILNINNKDTSNQLNSQNRNFYETINETNHHSQTKKEKTLRFEDDDEINEDEDDENEADLSNRPLLIAQTTSKKANKTQKNVSKSNRRVLNENLLIDQIKFKESKLTPVINKTNIDTYSFMNYNSDDDDSNINTSVNPRDTVHHDRLADQCSVMDDHDGRDEQLHEDSVSKYSQKLSKNQSRRSSNTTNTNLNENYMEIYENFDDQSNDQQVKIVILT